MPYVITDPCIGTCDTACVEVCPVDCIAGPLDHEELQDLRAAGQTHAFATLQLYIDPDICIDCGKCMEECPVEAIFEEDDVPAKWMESIERNRSFFQG